MNDEAVKQIWAQSRFKLNATGEHLHVVFVQAFGGAVLAFDGTFVAGFDAGLIISVWHM